jgi:putative nucleotidyltransferase with HDIG domain
MKQWLSKFRAQRLRDRFKDGIQKSPDADLAWWNQPLISLLIGLGLWGAASVLIPHDGAGRPGDLLNTSLLTVAYEILLLAITLISGMLLRVLAPEMLKNNTRLLLLALCALAPVLPASVLLQQASHMTVLPPAAAGILIPFALAPLLAGVLLGGAAAVVAGLWTTMTCFMIGNFSVPLLISGLIATAFAARMARGLRRRTQLIRVGLLIGLFQMACLTVLIPADSVMAGKLVLMCVCSGLGAALLTLLLLPLCETLFGATSNMTLLELSDLAHPLLQRLAFEAPGTYHHSLMLANLVQAAADAIGANSILARVGAYFHDIGKITKPGFFTENIRNNENPHGDLTPSMSALLVMAHIKEGLSLAMLHKLPRPIMDMIQQHHGTGLVFFFHHKAGQLAQAESQTSTGRGRSTTVDESSYRYPGPKPTSRESAILMLADSVEAASRSLDKPTAAAISELVDRLVTARFEDKQLDACDMTLAELSKVKRAFVFCLSNMLHSRIAYPKAEEKKS